MKLKHDKNYNVYVGKGDNLSPIAPGEVVEFEDDALAQSQLDTYPEILIKTEDKATKVFDKDGKVIAEQSKAKPEPKPEPKPEEKPAVEAPAKEAPVEKAKVEEPKKPVKGK